MKKPSNLNEIVEYLNKCDIDWLFLAEFKSTPKDELIKFHSDFGRWIRNSLGLWEEDSVLVSLFNKYGLSHPDNMSHFIMRRIFFYLFLSINYLK